MDWRPKGYELSAKGLICALCDSTTDEHKILMAAANGSIELFAKKNAWNAFLWLMMNTLKVDGKAVYSPHELGALKESLPIVWV
ncbi:MAG: hypothetical protein VW270_20945 [Candidatus Poseidoniales archaeon]|jgi:hypothetical protein